MEQLTELYIKGKITDRIHELSLKFSYEMLHEGYSFLCPRDIQRRFYEKWAEYALTN